MDLDSYVQGVMAAVEVLLESGQEDVAAIILQKLDLDSEGNLGPSWS